MAQDIRHYYDYRIVPAGSPICYEFTASRDNEHICVGNSSRKEKTCVQVDKRDLAHGWLLYTEDAKRDIHRRPSLWKWKFEKGADWEGETLFHNVATGASITGFARAHLLRAIHTIGIENVIYCDTDSIICGPAADLSRLPISDALGDWGIEDENAEIGHFAGKKLYGIKSRKLDKHGKPILKIASKGSKLAFEDIEKIIRGETVTWKSPAPSFRIDGMPRFVVREIRKTAASR